MTAKKTTTTERRTVSEEVPPALRQRAFDRLVEFASDARFASSLRSASDEFWSEEFGRRPDSAKAAAFARNEAEGGLVAYALLDVVVDGNATIAEIFLAERGKLLAKRERHYLERLARTRMGLYEITVVNRDRGLTLIDLWSGEQLVVRERLLTHDVSPGNVIATRLFPALDGATELEGVVYVFARREADELTAILRGEWDASRATVPSLSEDRFFKRHAGPLINRFWFDNVFFAAFDDGSTQDFAELGEFLDRSSAPNTTNLSRIHGLLCAIACGPVPLMPSSWLPRVWGPDPPNFDSGEQMQRIVSLLFELNNHVVNALEDGSFQPLLPGNVPSGRDSVAQDWCKGFLEGVDLGGRAWDVLFKDRMLNPIIMPILMLADPRQYVDDATDDPEATAELVKMLPMTVSTIAAYWRTAPPPAAKPTWAAGAGTVHRLKIQLIDVKPPVWRRVEIASDTKLPVVSRILLASMGWTDSHLHMFEVGSTHYGVRDPDFPDETRSERSVTLAQIAPNPKDRFMYDYDFGDGWRHRVTVEAITEATESRLPRCIAGARACPPEDCGGVPGYEALLEALADPTHEEHEHMRAWAPKNFDPNKFDLAATNEALRRIVRPRRSKSS